MVVASTIVAAIMAIIVAVIRIRAAKKPASAKKIILPPLFMSTGFLMFAHPLFRLGWDKVFEAFIVGALFSILLIKTSNFEIRDNQIFLKRSKAFIFILFGLLIFRILLKSILGQYISFYETSGMFFILAFGMILNWRIAMYFGYRKLEKELYKPQTVK